MKIYLAVSDPFNMPNPYVQTLVESIRKRHSEIEFIWGHDNFWNNQNIPEIIHIHWPDYFCSWEQNHRAEDLSSRLLYYKRNGAKIIATCHNLVPHYNNDNNLLKCYEVVYGLCDLMIHLGSFSFEIMSKTYTSSKHIIISHHIYDEHYTYFPTKEEACAKLSLDSRLRYILCFGVFRSEEERNMVINVAKQLRKEGIGILAPNLIFCPHKRFVLKYIKEKIKMVYYKYFLRLYVTGGNFNSVPEQILPYYYAVSEVSFIQRLKILNSGNVPMGFLFKNVVVGPNTGNVGLELMSFGNPTFNPNDIDSIVDSIMKGFDLAKKGLGEQNYNHAKKVLSTETISERIYNAYYNIALTENND